MTTYTCECCGDSIQGQPAVSAEGDSFCAPCVASLMSEEVREARAEVERLREAAARALGICENAADMQCECDGYYRCAGCERKIADRAGDAADVLRDALAPAATGKERS